jgi:hypothetical protein
VKPTALIAIALALAAPTSLAGAANAKAPRGFEQDADGSLVHGATGLRFPLEVDGVRRVSIRQEGLGEKRIFADYERRDPPLTIRLVSLPRLPGANPADAFRDQIDQALHGKNTPEIHSIAFGLLGKDEQIPAFEAWVSWDELRQTRWIVIAPTRDRIHFVVSHAVFVRKESLDGLLTIPLAILHRLRPWGTRADAALVSFPSPAVEGRLLDAGAPLARTEIRLSFGGDSDDPCDGSGATTTTASDGSFAFEAGVAGTIDDEGPVGEPWRLCRPGSTAPLTSSRFVGHPARTSIRVDCDVAAREISEKEKAAARPAATGEPSCQSLFLDRN